MIGIREAAMSKENEEKEPKYNYGYEYPSYYKPYNQGKQTSLYKYDEWNPTKEEMERDEKEINGIDEYEENRRNQIIITFTIAEDTIEGMKKYYDNYDFEPVKAEAITIAYDKLTDLLGKGFESKYTMAFEADEGYGDIEVTVTLTKNK